MAFKTIANKHIVANTPEELLNDLKTRKIKGLIAHQADILRAYYDQHDKATDIALQLPTGSGKTLVGLLIAEWRRIKYGERVIYLCSTNQLVHQAVEQARNKYGLTPTEFVGKQKEYAIEAKTSYNRAESIAITNYSSFFCDPTFFANAQVIVLDDVHAADNYIAKAWTLEIDKLNSNQKPIFDSLTALLRTKIPHSDYLRLADENSEGAGMDWVEKIPTPVFSEIIPDIVNVLDINANGSDWRYEYRRIRDNLNSCHMYLSATRIVIRPILPPTKTHNPFLNAKQRVYMSATFGEGGELERLTGTPSIMRLPVPKGWDKQGIGRRLFIFPELSLNEDTALTLACGMVAEAKRALFLLPSMEKAKEINDKIALRGSFNIFTAKDLETSKDKFITSNNAIALLANRYDGIDFCDEDCRLLIIVGISRATNLQERFFISRICALPLYNDRIITRIVQATGRCTRSPNDYSAVVILSDDFAGFLMQREKTSLFHPELQAEIEFGIQQSRNVTIEEFMANLKIFLEQDNEWKNADASILELRNKAEQSKLPAVVALKNAVANEVAYQYAMWNEDYKEALDCCRNVLNHLSGDPLKGYRAFWNYLAGSAAWLGSQKGIAGLDKVAQDYFRLAALIAPQIRWLTGLLNEEPEEIKDSNDPNLTAIIERLEVFLEKCGTFNNLKFEAEVKKITDNLSSGDSNAFETGHELLGKLLGFDAGNTETTAAPDPWWIADSKLCFIFEDHMPKNEESSIGANKVRQAASHPKWVSENLDINDNAIIIPVMISPRSKIEKDAAPYAGDVRFWHMKEFMKWVPKAIGTVRDLRKNYPGRGDLVWRAEACEAYKHNNIAPKRLIENVLKQKLGELEKG
ncbi:MAG: DEAD/DEAH box helicase [Sedimentisphaerales bacterium]